MPQSIDLDALTNGLCLESQQPCSRLPWLDESHRRPEDFWHGLKRAADRRFAVGSATSIFNTYHLYSDILLRNRQNPAPAICWYDSAEDFRSMSYPELEAAATTTADAWAGKGVSQGDTLCILLPFGPAAMVALLSALKMGARFSCLSPHGARYIQTRLDLLKADHIVTENALASLLHDRQESVLPIIMAAEEKTVSDAVSHSFTADAVVFSSFDPHSPSPEIPIEVTGNTAYLSALRDGAITLGLAPGRMFAAPGFDIQEFFPGLPLSGLLCGATFLHLEPEQVAEKPDRLLQTPLTALGVTRRLRDILLEQKAKAPPPWQGWFRNISEAPDMEQWQYFIRKLHLDTIHAFNLKWRPSLGGCAFISHGRRGMAHMGVLPTPGCVWQLDSPPPGDSGMCRIAPPGAMETDSGVDAGFIFKIGQEWCHIETDPLHREGGIYPAGEVLDSLSNLSKRLGIFFSQASLPSSDTGVGFQTVLLVFTGGAPDIDLQETETYIRQTIGREMGEVFQPDHLAFFPLYPRFRPETEIDHDWCRSQYLSGGLARRSASDLCRCTTRFRQLLINENMGKTP